MQAKLLLALIGLAWTLGLNAQQAPLPQPLTLEAALIAADASHPDVLLGAARRDAAAAGVQQTLSDNDPRVSLIGELRYVEPWHRYVDTSNNDSLARLVASKRLYDFGYSAAREQAAEGRLSGAEWDLLDDRQGHRLAVMQAFFDVLLADLVYARDNEELATVFIAMDRARDRRELGQASDVTVAELETAFQRVRQAWVRSKTRQRLTRTRLAQLLNRPDDPPSELLMPGPVDIEAALPGEQALQQQALADNPRLKALRARLEAADQQLVAARKRYGPVLRAEAETGRYERRLGSRNDWEAGLVLEVPLYAGRADDAAVAEAQAERAAALAELRAAELEVRQAVLENRLALEDLKARMQQVTVLGDFRELYLDRSRALYEMEVRTDLGDAMVQMSVVRLERAKVEFDWRLAQARLAALTGRLIDEPPQEDTKP